MSGGNCRHNVSVEDSESDPTKKVVMLVNDNDEFYVEYFRTRDEIDAFICALETAAQKAFGPAGGEHNK